MEALIKTEEVIEQASVQVDEATPTNNLSQIDEPSPDDEESRIDQTSQVDEQLHTDEASHVDETPGTEQLDQESHIDEPSYTKEESAVDKKSQIDEERLTVKKLCADEEFLADETSSIDEKRHIDESPCVEGKSLADETHQTIDEPQTDEASHIEEEPPSDETSGIDETSYLKEASLMALVEAGEAIIEPTQQPTAFISTAELLKRRLAAEKQRAWVRETVALIKKKSELQHEQAMAILHRVRGEESRAAYHQMREKKYQEQSLSHEDLWREMDKVVAAARDPKTRLLGRRRDETSDAAEKRLEGLQRSIDCLWRDNQDGVIENTPKYIEGFPARQVRAAYPPRFLPHYRQQEGSGLRACQHCLDVGMRCSRTFGIKHDTHMAVFIGPDLECRRCERAGIKCVQGNPAKVPKTGLPALPMWYENWMTMNR